MAIIKSRMKHFRMSPAREIAVNKALESMPWIKSFTDLMERALHKFLLEHANGSDVKVAVQASSPDGFPGSQVHSNGPLKNDKVKSERKCVFQDKLELKNAPPKKKKAKK